MTDNHPITLSPELVQAWINRPACKDYFSTVEEVAITSARWGADQELEACCEWLVGKGVLKSYIEQLRAIRRPKPPSLKLRIAEAIVKGDKPVALSLLDEALPDD